MTQPPLVVVAGISCRLGNSFLQGLNPTVPVFAWLPLEEAGSYTNTYAKTLYGRLCAKLRRREKGDRENQLLGVRLILLYAEKGDGSEAILFETFGVEALVTPFRWHAVGGTSRTTGNQRRQVANRLVREARRAFRHAGMLLDEIAWEVSKRDSRTCLLLPPKNFGRPMNGVFDYLKRATLTRMPKDTFNAGLRLLSDSLPTKQEGKRRYFVNPGRVVFRSPGKSGSRHGVAPVWEDAEHESSCVMRGRLRCGVSYNPRLHYDCSVPAGHSRFFSDCHGGGKQISRDRNHVNIAPNDNIR